MKFIAWSNSLKSSNWYMVRVSSSFVSNAHVGFGGAPTWAISERFNSMSDVGCAHSF